MTQNQDVRRVGFTLIELLVVIAIISILAAILFPVFARARENARRASCASNLKQLALGAHMYSQDFDGRLPEFYNPPSSMAVFYPYVKNRQVYKCPSANLERSHLYNADTSSFGTEYGMPAIYPPRKAALANINYGGEVTIMDAIPEAAKTCLFAETIRIGGSNDKKTGWHTFDGTAVDDTSYGGLPVLDRHFEGSNYAFMDGHVKWLKKEAVSVPQASNNTIKFYWN